MLDVRPNSKEDMVEFANNLAERLNNDHSLNPFFLEFVDQLAKNLGQNLKDVQVRKVSSTLATLANEKQKAIREADKGGKKKATKPKLGMTKLEGPGKSFTSESLIGCSEVILADTIRGPTTNRWTTPTTISCD